MVTHTFIKGQDWADHELNFHIDQTPSVCEICSAKVGDLNALQLHIDQYHSDRKASAQIHSALQSLELKQQTIPEEQTCPFCFIKPKGQKNGFLAHVAKHLQEISLAAIPASAYENGSVDEDSDLIHTSESDEPDDAIVPWIVPLWEQTLPATPLKETAKKSMLFAQDQGTQVLLRLAVDYKQVLELCVDSFVP